MPLNKQPKPLPSELNYVPKNSVPYRVQTDDSWWTLAERAEAKHARMSANDLCFFNFKTRKPTEINWYLRNKVGCTEVTKDGKNYVFSNSANPGVIYLPQAPVEKGAVEYPVSTAYKSNAWLGLGAKAGTQFGVIGIETMIATVFSLDEVGKAMVVTASINRPGPGVGASGGVAVVLVSGVSSPGQLNGHQQMEDWDFNVSLGANWGKMAKGAKNAAKMKPLVDALAKIGASTPDGLKRAMRSNPDRWAELIKAVKTGTSGISLESAEPRVDIFDLPLIGGGVEASLILYPLSNYNAVWDTE